MKTEYLPKDVERGYRWYAQHKIHVDKIIKEEKREYPMSGSDISKPELWKPAAWRWFFMRYGNVPPI